MEQKQQSFSTIGYIAAALGMCIGTGNVWRFPRICAANGGGSIYFSVDNCDVDFRSSASFGGDGNW